MSKFAEPMSRLIDELKKLPGVGAKSAQRLAFYILRSSDEDAEALATAVRDVKANLRLCSVCNNITDGVAPQIQNVMERFFDPDRKHLAVWVSMHNIEIGRAHV